MNLVEVVHTVRTTDEAVATALAVCTAGYLGRKTGRGFRDHRA